MAKGSGKSTGRTPHTFSDAPVTTDPRFAKVHTDPRFLKPKRDDTKVVVDERFKGLFEDDKSKKGKKTDKYGRKIAKGQSDADQMKRFYRLEDDDLDPAKADLEDEEEEDSDEDADGAGVDYARGEGDLESSSEEESSEEEEDDDESGDSSSEDDVMIGPSSVIDRERRKKAARSARFGEDDDDDDGLGSDIGEIDLDEDVDEAVYAQLDAQAERAIAEGGIEGDESDSEAEASSSRKKGKGKEKSHKAKSSKNKISRGDDTCRLAAVNLDWDHVRAKDIYKVFSSIVSPLASITAADALQAHRRAAAVESSSSSSRARAAPAISQVRGKLLHVRVYPSDFGKERMAKEDLEGPPPEIFKGSKRRNNGDDSSSEDEEITAKTIVQVDEGGEFDEEALRKYQLDRLRYYYAVATFDSKETARHVYNEIDGTEMERTANVFDLRFVPDGMEFPDGEEGRDAEFRDEATEDVVNYKGVDFKTDALRHSRVKLTWDQDDPERSKLTRMVARGGLTKEQLRDDDFKAYLASDTESEPDEEELAAKNGRDRLRALLNLDGGDDGFGKKGRRNGGVFDDPRHDDDDEQGEMQITFMPGLSEAAAKKSANGSKKTGEDETTLEKYLRKQKEKKERKKARRGGADEEEAEAKKDEDANDGAIGSTDAGFDHLFFNKDVDMEAALAAEFGEGAPSTKMSKKPSKKSSKKPSTGNDSDEDPAELARQRAHLTTIIGDTNDELTQDGRQHFDMRDILRQESGKDAKRAKLLKRLSKKKQREEQEFQERKGAPLVQDTFEIDAKDDRFSALMDDHRFAIDPTHPGFAKTKAMQTIMDERRRRLDLVDAEGMPQEQNGREKSGKDASNGNGDGELSALVEKLKRRSNESAGDQQSAKRRKRKSNA
ncbi:related to ESF1-18S rRNA factor, nucleolar protein involved in pre-rRNA processing [Sporisorium scitamineum]|uniref:Related to ESF1-18S rRNA factor, nucleolar protein involved in pre-rRNA processing n=2 Tax=Sporisorium scitamineum TaxID=49012 RepID=A0A127ZCS2_9BASI|nr:related to ESF1-18S rRNA factor, nucleolar protein involved in pre-rRNA processing [Sporisorium scitamineum]